MQAACLCSLLIWRDARAQFQRDSAFTLVAVFLLFCLLAVVLSLWFLAQKFFYVKLVGGPGQELTCRAGRGALLRLHRVPDRGHGQRLLGVGGRAQQ